MEPEFAPQHPPKERRRRLLLHGALCLLVFGALYWWALPRFRLLSTGASCETIFGMPGSTLLLYAAFVGAPLMAAVLIVVLTARSSIESIATRRYPPPGRKVFRRVKVKKGWQAVALALVPAMFITYLCVLSSQGMATAAQMAHEAQQSAECQTDPDTKAPPHGARSRESAAGARTQRPAR